MQSLKQYLQRISEKSFAIFLNENKSLLPDIGIGMEIGRHSGRRTSTCRGLEVRELGLGRY